MSTAIIGGGASGMMCAALLSELGEEVVLFEKNTKCGRKLAITGKGRCNVTNNCSKEVFFANIPTNPRFLFSAYSRFSPADTMDFFESRGVPLKTERGNRVFPVSDRAYDIVDALFNEIKTLVRYEKVISVTVENGRAVGLKTVKKEYRFDNIVVATGGMSYPLTGSDGDGIRFAEELGLETVQPCASLVPLCSRSKDCAKLMGLSLKNVSLKIQLDGKEVYSDFGEMLFTHFGLSGPMILSASATLKNPESGLYTAHVDLKPALDEKTLDARLLKDFSENINRDFGNSLGGLLPSKLIPVFVSRSGIPSSKKVNSITKEERKTIISLLKDFEIPISGTRPIEEAIITRGGISVNELNPRTMKTKKIDGLYFIGEVVDIDGYTGGFNLQIAFSTAATAAHAIIGY